MKTSLLSEIKTAVQIALFKKADMHHVASDKHKTPYAYYIIIISAILGLIGQQLFLPIKPGWGMAIGMAVMQIIMTIIGIYILSIIAKSIFKGHAKHDEFFRVMGYTLVIGFLSILPMLGLIVAIWGLILVFVILKTIHKLTTGGAIGTIIVGIIIMAVVSMIVSPIFGKIGLDSGMRGKFDIEKIKGMGGVEGTMEVVDEDSFEFNMEGEEGGNIKMDDGKVTIEGPGGQKMEFTIPDTE